jgi:hypothetical protein
MGPRPTAIATRGRAPGTTSARHDKRVRHFHAPTGDGARAADAGSASSGDRAGVEIMVVGGAYPRTDRPIDAAIEA